MRLNKKDNDAFMARGLEKQLLGMKATLGLESGSKKVSLGESTVV